MKKLTTVVLLLLCLTALVWLPRPTTARQAAPSRALQYAAKFVCGPYNNVQPAPNLMPRGRYFTNINVHNPSNFRDATFRKKFAVAMPRERAGRISPFFLKTLRPDEAMTIDCDDIYEHLNENPNNFVEGFAVIETLLELDVVSVYAAGQPSVGPLVTTMHTERVPPRPYTPCRNLSLSLDTGTANWQVVQDPDASTQEPRPASVITTPSAGWTTALAPAKWMSYKTAAAATAGVKHSYELCFCLCTGFNNPALTLRAAADDRATVSLNGTPLTPQVGGWSAPTNITQPANLQQLLRPGTNCLRVDVEDTVGVVTGFVLSGTFTAGSGQCPTAAALTEGSAPAGAGDTR